MISYKGHPDPSKLVARCVVTPVVRQIVRQALFNPFLETDAGTLRNFAMLLTLTSAPVTLSIDRLAVSEFGVQCALCTYRG